MIQRKNGAIRQTEIVAAARKVIVESGSENLTVRRLAEAAGLSEGDLYKHFKSKKDILSFLIKDTDNLLREDLEKSVAQGAGILGTLEQVIFKIQERKGVSFQIMAEIISLGDARLNAEIHNVVDGYVNQVRDILELGVKAGELRRDLDLDAAASLYFTMVQGMVNMWTLSNYGFDLKERYSSVWSLYREIVARR